MNSFALILCICVVFSPFLPLYILSCIMFIFFTFFILIINFGNYKIKLSQASVIFFLFVIYSIISTLINFEKINPASIIHLIASLFLFIILDSTNIAKKYNPINIALVSTFFISVFLFFTVYKPFYSRFSAHFENSNTYVLFLFAIIILNFNSWVKNKRLHKLWALIFLCLSCYILLFTGSRKMLLLFSVSMFLTFIYKKNIFNLYIICSFLVFFIFYENLLRYFPFHNRFFSIFSFEFLSSSLIETSNNIRYEMALYAFDLFCSNPIFGNGYDSFRYLAPFDNRYSHCGVLELLCNLGIIGFMIYTFFLYKIFKNYILPIKSIFIKISAVLFVLLLMFFDVVIYSPYFYFLVNKSFYKQFIVS